MGEVKSARMQEDHIKQPQVTSMQLPQLQAHQVKAVAAFTPITLVFIHRKATLDRVVNQQHID